MKIFLILASLLMSTQAQYGAKAPSVSAGALIDSFRAPTRHAKDFFTTVLTGLNTGINNYLGSADFGKLQKLSQKAPTIYTAPKLEYQPLNFGQRPKVNSVPFARKLQEALSQRAIQPSFQIQPIKTSERQPLTSSYGSPASTSTFGSTYFKHGSIIPSQGIRVMQPPRFSASIRQAPVSRQQIHQSLLSGNSAGSIVKAKQLYLPHTTITSYNQEPQSTYKSPIRQSTSFRASLPAPAFKTQIVQAYRPPTSKSTPPVLEDFDISNAINIIEDRRPQALSNLVLGQNDKTQDQSQSERAESYKTLPSPDPQFQPIVPALRLEEPVSSYGAPDDSGIGGGYPDPTSFRLDGGYSGASQGYQGGGGGGGYASGDNLKYVFVHAAPEYAPEPPRAKVYQPPVAPDVHQQIIFVKAPGPLRQAPTVVELPPPPQTKTVVYVLVKKPEPEEDSIRVVAPAPTKPTPPEVYFVRYAHNAPSYPVSDFNRDTSSDGYQLSSAEPQSPDLYAPQMTHSNFNYKRQVIIPVEKDVV